MGKMGDEETDELRLVFHRSSRHKLPDQGQLLDSVRLAQGLAIKG